MPRRGRRRLNTLVSQQTITGTLHVDLSEIDLHSQDPQEDTQHVCKYILSKLRSGHAVNSLVVTLHRNSETRLEKGRENAMMTAVGLAIREYSEEITTLRLLQIKGSLSSADGLESCLGWEGCKIEALNFFACNLLDSGVESLVRLLSLNRSVLSLNLSQNQITLIGSTHLANMLRAGGNNTLVAIDLSGGNSCSYLATSRNHQRQSLNAIEKTLKWNWVMRDVRPFVMGLRTTALLVLTKMKVPTPLIQEIIEGSLPSLAKFKQQASLGPKHQMFSHLKTIMPSEYVAAKFENDSARKEMLDLCQAASFDSYVSSILPDPMAVLKAFDGYLTPYMPDRRHR